MPTDLREAAVDLIRALASVAGDEDAVLAVLEEHSEHFDLTTTRRTAIAALVVTFGSCIEWPQPINPAGALTPVNLDNLNELGVSA